MRSYSQSVSCTATNSSPGGSFCHIWTLTHVTLTSTLACFHQFVDCPTRKNRTIDLMYANVRDAYTASPLPPLGKSDHNLIHLTPLYTPLVKRQPLTICSIRKWKKGDEEILRDCFETTDWHVMLDSFGEDMGRAPLIASLTI